MNNITRGALLFSGWVLRGLSIGCIGWLCYQLADGAVAQWLAAIGGMFIQLAAFLMLPSAALWVKEKRFWLAAPALVYCALVFAVSTGAAVTFLEYGEQVRQQVSASDETTILYKALAQKDIENGYRDRALGTLNKVSERERSSQSSATVASVLAGLYQVDSDSLRRVVWVVFALLMDGGAVLASVLPALAVYENGSRRTGTEPEEREQEQPETGTEEQENSPKDISASDCYQKARAHIASLDRGTEISVRHVKDALNMGYKKARKLVDQLALDGLIEQGGKSYIVTGDNNNGSYEAR